MKKLMALVLTLTLVLSMAVMANAEETHQFGDASGNYTFENKTNAANIPNYTAKGNVNVKITPPATDPVYFVVVEWGNLNFEYSYGTNPQWNPEDHKYEGGTAAGWQSAKSATITVTNHSNVEVYLSVDELSKKTEGITVTYKWADSNTVTTSLGEADTAERLYDFDAADSVELNVSVDGIPEQTSDFKVDEVIITISATNPNP